MSKAANEASGTNEANKANGTYGSNGAYGTVSQPQGKPLEPKTFLPKKGNYRGLIVYQKAECIYDITFYFAHHYFVERKDRTIDQVVQAARSAKQNIAEGCAAAMLDRLQKDFVEKGGIREQMTAARLGYRNEQKARIAELEAENAGLKARIAELERKVKELMGPMGLIGLIGLMGLVSCSSSSDDAVDNNPPTPVKTEVPISFSGSESQEEAVSNGENNKTNRAYGTYGANRRAAGKSLSESATNFTVWGYKNMSYTAGSYGDLQTVFPGYQVDWHDGSAASTTSNTNGWEYVRSTPTEQTIKYWDFSAKAYRYFAVTAGAGNPDKTIDGQVSFTMTADCSGATDEAIATNMANAPFFSHLWFSTGNVSDFPDKQFGKPVQLEFIKPFARVRFLFNYSYAAEGVKVTSPSFKPTNGSGIARKGTVKVTYPLTGTATKESYAVTKNASPAEGEELTAFTEEYIPEGTEKWYIVLPVLSQESYTMSVSVNNTSKSAVVPAEYMSWKPGYSYTYIFKITEEGGVEIELVQAAVTAWTDMSIVHSVYNW